MSPIKYFCADCKRCQLPRREPHKLSAAEREILNINVRHFSVDSPNALGIIMKTLAATDLEAVIYKIYLRKLQRLKRSGFKCRKAESFTTPIEQACSMLELRRGIE